MAIDRILALDVGDRRIGLAITDALGLTAQPLFTLHRTHLRADLKSIARFIRRHGVSTLVIGNPLHANGLPSPQAVKVQELALVLQQNHPTLRHHLFDERFTTQDAHALLNQAGHGPRSAGRSHGRTVDRKEVIDQIAATLILESFLGTLRPALLPDPDAELHPDTEADPGTEAGTSGDAPGPNSV